jgi:hypothetical protein
MKRPKLAKLELRILEALWDRGRATMREIQETVGIELGRASCKWRVTSPALSVAEWVHSSTMATFPEAPL